MPRRPSVRPAALWAPLAAAILLPLALLAALRLDAVSAQTLAPGTQARVSADGDSLRMRANASTTAAIIATIPDGTIVNVRDGTQSADGYVWQFIDWGGAVGWVAAMYLQPLGSTGTPAPTPPAASTPLPTPPPASGVATGTITGNLPPTGKAGLVVWGGGSMESLVATAGGRGCNVRSVYTVKDGRFIGYTPGAPAFVNANWNNTVGAINSISALLVFCDLPGQASTPAPSGGLTPTSNTSGGTAPRAAAVSDPRPPGPGGNQ